MWRLGGLGDLRFCGREHLPEPFVVRGGPLAKLFFAPCEAAWCVNHEDWRSFVAILAQAQAFSASAPCLARHVFSFLLRLDGGGPPPA